MTRFVVSLPVPQETNAQHLLPHLKIDAWFPIPEDDYYFIFHLFSRALCQCRPFYMIPSIDHDREDDYIREIVKLQRISDPSEAIDCLLKSYIW